MTESVPDLVPSTPLVSTYTSRPISIEAVQWDGSADMATPIIDWVVENDGTISLHCADFDACERGEHVLRIRTLEGTMDAAAGWWIIKGTEGEFYPCKDSVFQRKYQADNAQG